MRKTSIILRPTAFLAMAALFYGCQQEDLLPVSDSFKAYSQAAATIAGNGDVLDFENQDGYSRDANGYITGVRSLRGAPVKITAYARASNVPASQWDTGNRANIFNTTKLPAGHPDRDLMTPNWNKTTPSLSKVLVVQELVAPHNAASAPNDNAHGGKVVLDFSEVGPVTVNSMNVLDIEKYKELKSRVDFYDAASNKINTSDILIAPTGDNGVGTVTFSEMKGVVKMVVTLDGSWNQNTNAGSGAIDNISFVPDNCDVLDFENPDGYTRDANGYITGVRGQNGSEVKITAYARASNVPASQWGTSNRANIFNTTNLPAGHPDRDLMTPNWNKTTPSLSNVLIVQELVAPYNVASAPNDNAHGGRIEFDFSEVGPVTVNAMNVLDIEKYKELKSRIDFYDAANNKINASDILIAPTGDNGVGTIFFSEMKGVAKMVVTFDGSWNQYTNAGSGAIDNIAFCKEQGQPTL